MKTKTRFERGTLGHRVSTGINRQATIGALAANFAAISFIIGFALYFTLLMDAGYPRLDANALQQLQFLSEHRLLLYVWYLIIYLFFGISLAFLCLVLHQRLQRKQPMLVQGAAIFGVLWVGLVIASGMVATIGNRHVLEVYTHAPEQAAGLWLAIQTIINALGGGNEIVGGLWLAMINSAGLKSARLPRVLGLAGLVIGVAGVLTIIPGWDLLMAVFGFGCVLWFGGLSVLFFGEH